MISVLGCEMGMELPIPQEVVYAENLVGAGAKPQETVLRPVPAFWELSLVGGDSYGQMLPCLKGHENVPLPPPFPFLCSSASPSPVSC